MTAALAGTRPDRDATLWLWGLALLALPVHRLAWRPLGIPLEPAEIAALPLLVYGAIAWARGRRVRLTIVDLGVGAWVAGMLTSAVIFFARARGGDRQVLHELMVTVYLAGLYLAIRISADERALRWFPGLVVASAAVAAALGVIGFGLATAGIDTPLAIPARTPFPYLGHAARTWALTSSPTMLASISMLALLLLVFAWKPRRWLRFAMGSVLALGFLLAFSKTILCLLAGFVAAAFVSGRRRDGGRPVLSLPIAAALVLLLATLYGVLTHVVIMSESGDRTGLERGKFVSGEPLARFSLGSRRYVVLGTNYFFNKRTSLIALARTWPAGVGPGRQPAFAGALQRQGLYPANLWHGAPHSTYLGVAAESGLPGVLGLVGFLGALTIGVVRLGTRDDRTAGFAAAALGTFVALLIEALATDVMHFRHYWWLAAVVAAWSTLPESRDRHRPEIKRALAGRRRL